LEDSGSPLDLEVTNPCPCLDGGKTEGNPSDGRIEIDSFDVEITMIGPEGQDVLVIVECFQEETFVVARRAFTKPAGS
jgi:hypothetical protein